VQFYCERFGTSLHDEVTLVTERKLVDNEDMVWRACLINELVMVRDGVCCLSSGEFAMDDDVCTDYILSVTDFFFVFFFKLYQKVKARSLCISLYI